jgi:hypothetical protein
MTKEKTVRWTDAVVLIGLCAIVVLTAGAMSIGGRIRAKTVMCQQNLRCIGQALNVYTEDYQGKLPVTDGVLYDSRPYIHAYYLLRAMTSTTAKPWYHLGCLFGSGLVTDGRSFYCPAAKGSTDDYLQYCAPAPWGSLPQNINNPPSGNGNQWLRVTKGYIYWPQSTEAADNDYMGNMSGNIGYKLGYPQTPATADKVDTSKAIVADEIFHVESQYKTNALFWDCSVAYQDDGKTADGKLMCFDATQYGGASLSQVAAGWKLVSRAEWMWQLHR